MSIRTKQTIIIILALVIIVLLSAAIGASAAPVNTIVIEKYICCVDAMPCDDVIEFWIVEVVP